MRWLIVGAVVGIGIGVIRFLAKGKPTDTYLSARWLKAQSYSRKGQGGWI